MILFELFVKYVVLQNNSKRIGMSFNLNNPIDFTKEYMYQSSNFKKFINEIQKKIPKYLERISEEWEISKDDNCITLIITSFDLKVLLEDCGFHKNFESNEDKKIVANIYAYDDEDDDNNKEIFLEIEDDVEIPTFSLCENQLVGSLYYFIKNQN